MLVFLVLMKKMARKLYTLLSNPITLVVVITNVARKLRSFLSNRIPFRIEILKARSGPLPILDRFTYQKRYVNFSISPDDCVLDMGSGGYPFPHATVLLERYLETSKHRCEKLVTDGKSLVLGDIHSLPFPDKRFDFVYCSHVLEHAEDPLKVCMEIMRVGKRGYIETPTQGKDALFVWARDVMHKWHIVAIGRNLCFFEYSQRQLDGIGSLAWKNLIFGSRYDPLQKAFWENQDLFNVMFNWCHSFDVFVFYLDGTVKSTLDNPTLTNESK